MRQFADLSQATFFLAVSLVDRTLSYVDWYFRYLSSIVNAPNVALCLSPRNKLQLLGASALFLAAKMEEVYPPQINEIVFITEETYE